jgi:iron complex outermembrane receptor protein
MHLHRIALAVAAAFPLVVLAQGIALDAQLKTVLVASARAPLDPNLPSSTASKTAEQLREQTVYNPNIAVNLPSTTVRKRYW